jgi:hypothetical protein
MHRKPELARRGSTDRLGVGKATPRELLWLAELTSVVATATTIQDQVPNEDGAFVEYWLSLALITISETFANLDPSWKFVQVRKPPAAVALQDTSERNVVGRMHVIPEMLLVVGQQPDGTSEGLSIAT